MVSRTQKKEAIEIFKLHLSERKSCRLLQFDRSVFRRKRFKNEGQIQQAIKEIAYAHRRWGYRQICREMRKRNKINFKKVYRIYTELGLKYRIKPRKKRLPMPTVPLQVPSSPNKVWSMDFVHDSFYSGKRFRILNIIDVFSRECIASEAEISITSERVTRVLNSIKANRNLPEQIVVDNGPEFISKNFLKWAAENKVEIRFINKGRPTENGFVESFNGKFRNECLNENWFKDLREAKQIILEWKEHYNTSRPHSSLGGISPFEYLKKVA